MKHPGRWLLFEQHLFVRKHVTLSQKMHLALLVSIPAPCFFDQQAVHDKNSKGDIPGFPNWEDFFVWTLQEDPASPKATLCLEPFSSFLHVWSCWHQVSYCTSCVKGADSLDSKCQSTTWSREDAIPKRTGAVLAQSVNCYGHVANIASQKQVEEAWIFRKETD